MADQYSIRVHIEEVENGQYVATSDEIPGLVAQGRTIEEAMEIAHDVAMRLLESYREHGDPLPDGLRRAKPGSDLDIAVTA
jgi:antitoxin HicB